MLKRLKGREVSEANGREKEEEEEDKPKFKSQALSPTAAPMML